MKDVDPSKSFVDGVVAYHQYSDFLGLTATESRHHPDTLEVFDDLTEVVATADELRMAYTGVLRYRGKKREQAEEYVQQIEGDINVELYDLDVITQAKYQKTRESLQTSEGIKKVAEGFVKLFRKVIPDEEMPARKKRTAPKAKKPPAPQPKPEIVQATRFVVERDEAMAISVNGVVPELDEMENSLFVELVNRAEADSELYMRSDVLINSPRWQNARRELVQQKGSEPSFGSVMKSLRNQLHMAGLGNMVEADGTGAGRVYRARVDYVKYASSQNEIVLDQQKAEVPVIDRETGEERAIRFASKTLSFIVDIVPDAESGRKISEIRKSVMHRLGLEEEEARGVIRDFIRSGDLHVIGNDNGIRLISPEPKSDDELENETTQQEALSGTAPEAYFTEEETRYVYKIVRKLADEHLERGIKIKSLWVGDEESEEIVRSVVSKVIKLGYMERFTPKLQRAAHSRRNTEPFVRFSDGDYWRASKRDLGSLLQEIQDAAANI